MCGQYLGNTEGGGQLPSRRSVPTPSLGYQPVPPPTESEQMNQFLDTTEAYRETASSSRLHQGKPTTALTGGGSASSTRATFGHISKTTPSSAETRFAKLDVKNQVLISISLFEERFDTEKNSAPMKVCSSHPELIYYVAHRSLPCILSLNGFNLTTHSPLIVQW